MVKIPTFESKLTPTASFTRPQQMVGAVESVNAIAKYANTVADQQTEVSAYEKGFAEQVANKENYVAQEDTYSIANTAYKKGAQAAFVSNVKTETESNLSQFALDNQYDVESYKTKSQEYKSSLLAKVPQSLLPQVSVYLDNLDSRYSRSIEQNSKEYSNKTNLVSIANRVDNLLPQLSSSIKTNGLNTNTSVNIYGEMITSIKALEESRANPTTINNLKIKLKDEVILSTIIGEFQKSDDKQAFIAKIQKGDVKDLLTEINDDYKVSGIEYGDAISLTDSMKYANNLNTLLKYDVATKKIDRQKFENSFDNYYKLSLTGDKAGDKPDLETARKLYFSEEKILEYQSKLDIIDIVAADVNKSKYGTLAESQNTLKESQSVLSIINNTAPSEERNKNLTIQQTKIASLQKVLEFKQQAIKEGDPYKILSSQGIQYSFNDEQDIATAHELVKSNVGINANRFSIMPKANLEVFKSEYKTADSQSAALGLIGRYKQQFGKYTPQFLRDAELTAGDRVVFDFADKRQADAGVIWQGLKDVEILKKSLGNSRADFATDEKAFADKFKLTYGKSFNGNEKVYNEIYNGAYAYYLKNLSVVGNNNTAIGNTIKLFGNEGGVYNYVTINNQSVFIPPNVNGNALKANVEDMFANPHRYAITSSNGFTLQDIVDNKEEYTVVIDGGTAKVVQNSNVLFSSEIYQKLPSGSKEFVYSDAMITMEDGVSSETTMLDFDATWSFDKKANLNSKIDSQIKDTKFEKGGRTIVFGVDSYKPDKNVNTTFNEKVSQLKEIVYKEIATKEGMSYLDVFSGDIAVTTRDQQNLNAISFYIKDSKKIPSYVLDYLSEFDYLKNLKNVDVREKLQTAWADKRNKVRATANTESIVMSPLHSITDIIRSIESINYVEPVDAGGA